MKRVITRNELFNSYNPDMIVSVNQKIMLFNSINDIELALMFGLRILSRGRFVVC